MIKPFDTDMRKHDLWNELLKKTIETKRTSDQKHLTIGIPLVALLGGTF